ncbi:MAG: PEGA domain-containing protein, partial [Thermoplasmatales archaeon]|nr:PEGA domain-containing protein [Thermoplasmatales archaeon]
ITIYDIDTVSHTIKLTKSGYEDYQKTVYVSAGSKESVSGNLRLIPTPTPTTSVPAFEVMFAIAGLLAVTYLLRRKK